jgi:hypothetical protein
LVKEMEKIVDLEKNRDNIYAFLHLKEFTKDSDKKLKKQNK